MQTTLDRIDPAQLKPEQLEQLEKVLSDSPCLVGREDFRLPLPDPIFQLLVHVAKAMRRGETILLIPENEELSTKAAAEFLGVSRPFLVRLIDEKKLPAHKVGAHRRVRLKDIKAFRDNRDQERRAGLQSLFGKIANAGHYDDLPLMNEDDCE